ncbi:MAG: XdhC family protein [Candidatus Limnocylindrales bacterium]
MRELLEQYDAWRAEGLAVGRAVVIRTYGSAPRQEGSVLLVADDGRMIGSVSGGCVEGAAAEAVLESRKSGHSGVIRYGISDDLAWSVGLACGGIIDVLVQPSVPDAVVAAARAQSAAQSDAGAGEATPSAPLGTTIVTDLPADTPPPASDRPSAGVAAEASLDTLCAEALAAGR